MQPKVKSTNALMLIAILALMLTNDSRIETKRQNKAKRHSSTYQLPANTTVPDASAVLFETVRDTSLQH